MSSSSGRLHDFYAGAKGGEIHCAASLFLPGAPPQSLCQGWACDLLTFHSCVQRDADLCQDERKGNSATGKEERSQGKRPLLVRARARRRPDVSGPKLLWDGCHFLTSREKDGKGSALRSHPLPLRKISTHTPSGWPLNRMLLPFLWFCSLSPLSPSLPLSSFESNNS